MNYGFQSFSSATECTLSTSRILPVQFLKVCLVQNFILKLYSHLLYSSPLSVHRLAGDCQAYSADPASAPEEISGTFLRTCKASLVAVSKESACSAGDLGSVPGLARSLGGGHGNPLQYSCLENLMDRGAWRAAVHTVTKSWTRRND